MGNSIDGVDRSLAAFRRDFVDEVKAGDNVDRVVLEIDAGKWKAEHGGYTPFVIVRYGKYTAVLDLMPLSTYLDIDVHAFVDGEQGATAVMGMNIGRRTGGFKEANTPIRSNGWPAARLVALFIGDVEGSESSPTE